MGQLTFQATLGGSVNLVGPNTASNFNLDVPAVASTIATLAAQTFAGTQTFTVDAVVNGLTVGLGAGSVSTNTVFGTSAYRVNTTGAASVVVGNQAGYTNSTGIQNVFIGHQAGYYATGRDSTFVGTGAGGAITSGTKNTIIGQYDGNGNGLDIRTASNYAVISDGDGNRLLSTANGYSLALDGGAVPQSGTGITFPATQSASSDANTLDDYEEGTFTPTTANFTIVGTATFSGSYTKIGDRVLFEVNVVATTTIAGTESSSYITLPFTPAAATTGSVSNQNGPSYGNGPINTAGNFYSPTFAGTNQTVSFSGQIQV